MTCMTAIKWYKKLKMNPETNYFKVSAMSASMIGTSANLKPGDEVSIWGLLHGLMLPSGNDAAYCLAEIFGQYIFQDSADFKERLERFSERIENKVSNPIRYFIREMNYMAQSYGMSNTYYANPHGLASKYNRSTAADIGRLCYHALKEETLRKIVCSKIYIGVVQSTKNEKIREIIWENTNKLLYEGFDGIKTGITSSAGPCLAASQKKDDKYLIVIVLNSKSCEHRWKEVKRLIDWAFDKLEYKDSSLKLM